MEVNSVFFSVARIMQTPVAESQEGHNKTYVSVTLGPKYIDLVVT